MLKVTDGIVTEVPLSMLTVVKSVMLSRKTIGGRNEEVESVGIVVLVFVVVAEKSVDVELFFISSTDAAVEVVDSVVD